MGCLAWAVGLLMLATWTGVGVFFLTEQKAHGESMLPAILVVTPALFIWAGILASTARRFIPSWQRSASRAAPVATLVLGVVATVGVYLVVDATIVSRRPGPELTASLAPACSGQAVAGAGALVTTGTARNHLIVLSSDGREHTWTGHPRSELRPPSVPDAELVVCASPEETRKQISVCHYINGPDITRYSVSRDIAVFAAATGQRLMAFTATADPRACGKTESEDLTELVGHLEWTQVEERLWYLIEHGVDIANAIQVGRPVVLEPVESGQVGVLVTNPGTEALTFRLALAYPAAKGAIDSETVTVEDLAAGERRLVLTWLPGFAAQSALPIEATVADVKVGVADPANRVVARQIRLTAPTLPIVAGATLKVVVRNGSGGLAFVRLSVAFLRAGALIAVGRAEPGALHAGEERSVSLGIAGDPTDADEAFGQVDVAYTVD